MRAQRRDFHETKYISFFIKNMYKKDDYKKKI